MIRNILIIEDKKSHMEALVKIISDLDSNLAVYSAYDIEKAYQISMEQRIHLFLVDIVLRPEKPGDVLGLKFVQEIREVQKYMFVPIIMVTSLEDPKLYSYSQLQCYGYIEKPYNPDQVRKMVTKALKFPIKDDEERSAFFRKDGIIYAVNKAEVIYVENSRRKVVIHSSNDILEIPYKTCDEILQELASDMFVQCSRYTIVNRNYIEKIDYTNRYIQLKYIEEPVEIGVIMKKNFKDKMDKR